MMEGGDQEQLVQGLILYCESKGVLRKDSIDVDLWRRESRRILKDFSREYYELNYPSNNKIEGRQVKEEKQKNDEVEMGYKKKKLRKMVTGSGITTSNGFSQVSKEEKEQKNQEEDNNQGRKSV